MFEFGRVAPTLWVKDLDRALRFYREALGFTLTFTNGHPPVFAILERDAAELHLGLKAAHAGSSHVHLMVKDLDALVERLNAAGADLRQMPKVQEWGLRDIVVADPDGNTLNIGETVST